MLYDEPEAPSSCADATIVIDWRSSSGERAPAGRGSHLHGSEVNHVVAGLVRDAQRVLPARQRPEALGQHGLAHDGVQRQASAPRAQLWQHLEPARALRAQRALPATARASALGAVPPRRGGETGTHAVSYTK